MPPINIPPRVRFALYLLAAFGLLAVNYAAEKHWAGASEVRFVSNLAALLQVLAAAKTNLSDTAAQAEATDATATALVARTDLPKRVPPAREEGK